MKSLVQLFRQLRIKGAMANIDKPSPRGSCFFRSDVPWDGSKASHQTTCIHSWMTRVHMSYNVLFQLFSISRPPMLCYFSCTEAVTVNVKSAVPRKSKGTSTSSQKDSLCHLPIYQRERNVLPCRAIPCTAHCLNNMLSWEFCMHVTGCLKPDICFPAHLL